MRKTGRTKALLAMFLAAASLQAGTAFGAQAAIGSQLQAGTWVKEDAGWKYRKPSGEMATGWVHTASGWYYLQPETGIMATGMLRINDRTYYFNQTPDAVEGKMVTGWYQDAAGKWYFFSTTADSTEGAAVTGWQWVDGRSYYFELAAGENTGKMFANGVTPDGYKVNADGQWVDENGNIQVVPGKGFSSNPGKDTNSKTTVRGGGGGGSSRKSRGFSGFSGGHFGGGFGQEGFGGSRSRRGSDLTAEMTISFDEAVSGCDKMVNLKGADGKTHTLQVHIPAGIESGKSIRLKGKGNPGSGNAEAGDLLIKVTVLDRAGFERKGMDVYTTVSIPFTTAVFGGEAVLQTLSGRVSCKIKPGTQSGSKIRLRGKGIVSMKDASVHGDQYVTVQIEVPQNLSPEAKQKLREFEEICAGSRVTY